MKWRVAALQALVLAAALARLGLHASELAVPPGLQLEGAWWQSSATQSTKGLLMFVRLHGGSNGDCSRGLLLLSGALGNVSATAITVRCTEQDRVCASSLRPLSVEQEQGHGSTDTGMQSVACGVIGLGAMISSEEDQCVIDAVQHATGSTFGEGLDASGQSAACQLHWPGQERAQRLRLGGGLRSARIRADDIESQQHNAGAANIPVRGSFVDDSVASMLGLEASTAPQREWVNIGMRPFAAGLGASEEQLDSAAQTAEPAAEEPTAHAQPHHSQQRVASRLENLESAAATAGGLEWTAKSTSFAEMRIAQGLMAGDNSPALDNEEQSTLPPALSGNASVMVGVDMRSGADTWSQMDAESGPAALALGAHQAQHLLDPAMHGLAPHVHAEWEESTSHGVVAGSIDWEAVPGGQTTGEAEADEIEASSDSTTTEQASIVSRLREAAREHALAKGDFAAAADTEAMSAEALLKRVAAAQGGTSHAKHGLDAEAAILHSLCDASAGKDENNQEEYGLRYSKADCRAAQLYKTALSSLSSPMMRSVSGLTRQKSGWASSDNIVAAIHRAMGTAKHTVPPNTVAGSQGSAGWESALLAEPDTWLSRRLNRSMEVPLDPHAKRVMRRAAGTAGAMLAAVANHHGSHRATELLKSGRLGARAVLAHANGSTDAINPQAMAQVLQSMGLHGLHGGLRSHQEVEAVFMQTASGSNLRDRHGHRDGHKHRFAKGISVTGQVVGGDEQPSSKGPQSIDSLLEGIDRAEAHDTVEAFARIGKAGTGRVGTARTGRHAAALAGMLLETDSSVKGLLRAGVTAKEAFACIVDQIMNTAPEILVQIIINVVRQPFADLMSIIMSLITPPMLAPVPFPKLSFPGPDKGTKPEPKPVKCECTAPPAGGGAGGGGPGLGMPDLPDFSAMLPFPMLLQEQGGDAFSDLGSGMAGTLVEAQSLWSGLSESNERQQGSAAGGLGATGDARLANLQQTATEGGGGVVADAARAQEQGVLPKYMWDLSSVPVGGDAGGLDVDSATESLRAATRGMRKAGASSSSSSSSSSSKHGQATTTGTGAASSDGIAGVNDMSGAEDADWEGAVAQDAETSRYTERDGRSHAAEDASLQAHVKAMALARLNKQTDEAVERAVSLGFSSDEAIGDLMRLASTGAHLTGQADVARMRARASLAAKTGVSATVEAQQVARLGLSVFQGQELQNEALGETRCGCPVGTLRVVESAETRFSSTSSTGNDVSGGAVSVTGSRASVHSQVPPAAPSSSTAGGVEESDAWHAAPEREQHAWYPYLHEKPPHSVQRRLDEAGEALRRRLDRARLESEALAPAGASATSPHLSKAADAKLDQAVHEAARFGQKVLHMAAPHTQDRSSHTPRRESGSLAKNEQDKSIRLSGHAAPSKHATDVMRQAMRAALGDDVGAADLRDRGFRRADATASETSTIRDPVIDAEAAKTTEWVPGHPLASAPRAALRTDPEAFQITPRNAAADREAGITSEEEEELDDEAAEKTDAALSASLLQAAAMATAKLPGGNKGAPISRIVVLVHRLLVSKLQSGALPAAKDRAISGILSSLPGLATRLVVLQSAPHMIPRLTTTLTSTLLRELVPRLLYGITFRTTQRVTKQLVPRLSTSLALTIARSITRDPSLDVECFYCFTKWDEAFRAKARSGQDALKIWLRDRALGRPVSDMAPESQALPAYCTPCLKSIHQGVALDDCITSRIASASEFYTDYYSSRGQAGLAAAKAVHTTVSEAREGFAAPEREWDVKAADMDLPE